MQRFGAYELVNNVLKIVKNQGILSQAPPNLINSHEEAVDVVSRRAAVHCLLVRLDLCVYKFSHFFHLSKNGVVMAGQMLQEPGKDIVHLWERGRGSKDKYCRFVSECFVISSAR